MDVSLSVEVAMVTAQFCMEHTFITNCYTSIHKQFEHNFFQLLLKATRTVLKENSVFVPGQCHGPAACGQIIPIGMDLRRSLIRPLGQSRVSDQIRPGDLGLYPVGFWKSSRLDAVQLSQTTCNVPCVQDMVLLLGKLFLLLSCGWCKKALLNNLS